MNATQLAAEIERRKAELQPALSKIAYLENQLREVRSREWIAAHKITREQVYFSSNVDEPWLGDICMLAAHVKRTSCTKPWIEWNGVLYPTHEVMLGRFQPSSPGLAEHLPPGPSQTALA